MSPAEARVYIALFCKYTLPGTTYVQTNLRRIEIDSMTDDDALFVAAEFREMEAKAAARRKVPTQ